jgi:hypothetical protein
MTIDSFEVEANKWITPAEHRRRNGPPAKLMYQPMLEVMQNLRANGCKT